jgi:hypothetical protein
MIRKTPEAAPHPAASKHLSVGTVIFTEPYLLKLAKDLKFTRRTPRKIDVVHLLASVCEECIHGSPSCNDLASQIQTISGGAPSRQAVNLRLNQAFKNILQRLLEKVIGEKIAWNGYPNAGADCIYRHKTGTIYLDPNTLDPIDLPALLKGHGQIDREVLLNNASRTRVRLVTAPVDTQTANLRRMKAKKETRGHHPSQAVLELMDWTIFITTIPATLASFKEILAIYGLRWRIEIIFKAWKNHMKFPLLHRVSKLQMAILLKARLLIIAACTHIVYGPLERMLLQNYDRRLSLLKFMRFLSKSPARFIRVLQSHSLCKQENQVFHEALVRYCCYDKRKRQNYSEAWDALA